MRWGDSFCVQTWGGGILNVWRSRSTFPHFPHFSAAERWSWLPGRHAEHGEMYQISLSKNLIKSQDVIRNAMKHWAEVSKLPCKSDFSFLCSIFSIYIYIIYIFFSVWALFVRLVTIAWMGRNRVHSAKPLDSNPISKGFFEGGHACLFVLLQSSEIIRMDTSSDKTFSIFFWKKWNADGQIALTLAFQVSRNSMPNALRECCFFFCRSLDDVFGWSDFHKH